MIKRGVLISIFLVFTLIFSMNFVVAEWTENLNNGLFAYYNFDNSTDQIGGYDLIDDVGTPQFINNASVFGLGKAGFTGDDEKWIMENIPQTNFTENNYQFTINVWMKHNGKLNKYFMGKYIAIIGWIGEGNITRISEIVATPTNSVASTNTTANAWFMLTVLRNATHSCVFINGTALDPVCEARRVYPGGNGYFSLGGNYDDTSYNGYLDEMGMWNRSLNISEINALYNNGNGITRPIGYDVSKNETYIQWENESILNVNSSDYWDNLDTYNSTQMTQSSGILSILPGWFTSMWESLFRNYFNQDLNTTNIPSFVGINLTGNYIYNNGNRYSFADLNNTLTSGISFTYYNLTTEDISTTGSTIYNTTILSLPLTAGKKVSIECNLLADSAATTTGIRLSSNVSSTSSVRQVIEYYTSATAQAICEGESQGLLCEGTGSAGTKTTPTRISIYTVQQNDSYFILDLKSEISGSAVNIRAGSWCRSLEV